MKYVVKYTYRLYTILIVFNGPLNSKSTHHSPDKALGNGLINRHEHIPYNRFTIDYRLF